MKRWREKWKATWRSMALGAAICAVAGLLASRVAVELEVLGYDLLFLPGLHERAIPSDLVIVHLNDQSFKELGQTDAPNWDRNLHAKLLDRLTADGAKVVAFDIVFIEPGTATANSNLVRAIRSNGRVVLAAAFNSVTRAQVLANQVIRPLDIFMDAPPAGWGVAATRDAAVGEVVRQYFLGDEIRPSMPWVAARVAVAPVTSGPGARQPDTWLNYYGPALSLQHVSFSEVANLPTGYFRDKAVFVGVLPKTLKAFEESDVFKTPYSSWGRSLFPGVEIGATAYLNIVNNDGLRRMHDGWQLLIFLGCGVVLGGGLRWFTPRKAVLVALGFAVGLLAVVAALASNLWWFGWPVIALVQIPFALAWAWGDPLVRLKYQKDVLTRTLEETTRIVEASRATAQQAGQGQLIPDHTLLKRIGKGAYGEVWLARNAIGTFHAVKIVRRAGFPADEPYEREFRGLQKFMPISRSHPGFVNILHAGRDDRQELFFCVMEAGDDKTAGQKIDPETYSPKSLLTELEWRGKISAAECIDLGIALAAALQHLHESQLIHRDIKPANIIYVNRAPKFADIGLVTDIRSAGRDVSFLGTEGYMAPEGPGTASADVYALGKVLYEAAMGRDRRLYPEVPTALYEEPSDALIRRLQRVIDRACEMNPTDRYQSAAALRADLLNLKL